VGKNRKGATHCRCMSERGRGRRVLAEEREGSNEGAKGKVVQHKPKVGKQVSSLQPKSWRKDAQKGEGTDVIFS